MAFANVSGHGLEPTVFWGGAGRQGSCGRCRTCLISMGVWRDPDRSQPNENPGAIRIRKERGMVEEASRGVVLISQCITTTPRDG
ncbi:hypothetical protein [Paraburkholderia phytofirmans]|uniref:hypothetical protein n=1 Tax=Paraburkholderia phytofirmans TaxID=261302 RepID=UPI0011DF5C2A|nr:hypothetical protein [Paraburkholderia phytofirmans]